MFHSLDSKRRAQIAQLVEQWTENPRVAGSIPALGIFSFLYCGPLAQAVEHLTFNQVVRGSSPRWLTKDQEILVFPGLFSFLEQSKATDFLIWRRHFLQKAQK